jgi:DNA-binding response OmpR family regulator
MTSMEGTATILVVDDDEAVRQMLVRALGAEGFAVRVAPDGPGAHSMLATERPDLVVLDLTLETEDGLDVLAGIRQSSDVPVILLTGRGTEHDRILGLKLGADDYLVKPFSPGELAARITSVLRRTRRASGPTSTVLDFGTLQIELETREVLVRGEHVDFTAKEFDLLTYMAQYPRQVFAREQLLQQVWASSSEWQDSATVTEHVRRLRRKIEDDPDKPRWIRTVRGVGYRFEP